jgi:hypothetical protein
MRELENNQKTNQNTSGRPLPARRSGTVSSESPPSAGGRAGHLNFHP